MLKALELVGFKSFADKTRLEFPPRHHRGRGAQWLGQVQHRRRHQMGPRRAERQESPRQGDGGRHLQRLGQPASTKLGRNDARLRQLLRACLASTLPRYTITRRVYRSGEGEYLINRQPCRLSDIRELFAGTGVATEAYSVIEQGKVDVLLQSSARERRMIFEEAAGISRFKAKKVEAQRRLERVEQNLLRLSDIVDEVDNRLKAVRLQAGKARRYKEYADRLQELRTHVALTDWRKLSSQLSLVERELDSLRDEVGSRVAEAESLEAQAMQLELQIADDEREIRSSEGRIAQNGQRIALRESAVEHERRHVADLDEEAARHRRQLSAMSVRAGDLEQQLQEIADASKAAQQHQRELAQVLAEHERGLTTLTARADQLRAEHNQLRSEHLEALRAAATLGNRISGLESKVASTQTAQERGRGRLIELMGRQETARDLQVLRDGSPSWSAAQINRTIAGVPPKSKPPSREDSTRKPSKSWPICGSGMPGHRARPFSKSSRNATRD